MASKCTWWTWCSLLGLVTGGCDVSTTDVPVSQPSLTPVETPLASDSRRASEARPTAADAPRPVAELPPASATTPVDTSPQGAPSALPAAPDGGSVVNAPISINTPASENELWRDSFADAAGAVRWNRDGLKSSDGPPSERTIYTFNGMPEGGPLVLRVVEDGAAMGPDGKPGVLALSWTEVPPRLPYSGFVYLGGRTAEQRLLLPPVRQAKSVADFRPLRVQFRYKGVNESRETPFAARIECRFEPMLADSYAKRIYLATLDVTGQWQTFDQSLAEGDNHEAFFQAIASENPESFKIVWAHSGPIDRYRSGDTLLIDDLVISNSPAEK